MRVHRILSIVVPAFFAAATSSCATTQLPSPSYSGGDGSSPELAVAILGAKTDHEFKAAETAWLSRQMPGFRFESGSYVLGAGAHHIVKVLLPDGSRKTVYFDVSRFGR